MHQVHETTVSHNSKFCFRFNALLVTLSERHDGSSFSVWMLMRKEIAQYIYMHNNIYESRAQKQSVFIVIHDRIGNKNVARTRNFLASVIPLSTCNKNRFYGNLKNARLLVDECTRLRCFGLYCAVIGVIWSRNVANSFKRIEATSRIRRLRKLCIE